MSEQLTQGWLFPGLEPSHPVCPKPVREADGMPLDVVLNLVWTLFPNDPAPHTLSLDEDCVSGEGENVYVHHVGWLAHEVGPGHPIAWKGKSGWLMNLGHNFGEKASRPLPLPEWHLFPMLGALLRDQPAVLADWYTDNGLPEAADLARSLTAEATIDGEGE